MMMDVKQSKQIKQYIESKTYCMPNTVIVLDYHYYCAHYYDRLIY